MTNQKDFKCKNCRGLLSFDVASQSLKCEYCGKLSTFESKPLETIIKNKYSADLNYSNPKDSKHIYECKQCKTKMADCSDKAATRCVGCGSKELIEIQADGVHPEIIIPFTISKDNASKIFKNWIFSRKFAPNDLKKMAKLQKLSGFYVPVYAFDLIAHTQYSATGIDYYEDSEGNKKSKSTRVSGIEKNSYTDYIIPATNIINKRVFDRFNGFDIKKSRVYASEYLLGFYGVGTDFNVHNANKIMNELIEDEEESKIRSKLNLRFDDVDFLRTTTSISNVYNSYYYAPVWANYYKYKDKDYHCYINGQTGKAYGKAPKSFWKIMGLVLGIIGGIAGIICLCTLLSKYL